MNAARSFWRVRWLAVFAPLLFIPSVAGGATLTAETVAAWTEYLHAAHLRMQARLSPGHAFLSIDEAEARAAEIRGGDPLIFPVGRTPEKVPAGLIHDWVGIAFIPNAKISDVLSTVRDYEHYSEFFRPIVLETKVAKRDGPKDQFRMLLANKSLISKTALDGDYDSSYVRVDDQHWYSISETTRMQEIQNYRAAGQHILPENEGSGLIWRLSSMTFFEERDGGVYIELEAMALSRNIPVSLRWIATPIVRRVSKNSLLTSLQQTRDAVCARNLVTDQFSAKERQAGRDAAVNTLGSFR